MIVSADTLYVEMNESDLTGIPEKVQKTEQSLLWFVQNVLRGSWFRRLIAPYPVAFPGKQRHSF